MVDAIITVVLERLTSIIEEQIQNEVDLVRGVEKEVLSLSDELKAIRNQLDDAETRRFKDKNVDGWLSRLEYTSYEMEDVLDEWNYAILKHKIENESNNGVAPKNKVCSFIPSSCLCFQRFGIRRDIAQKMNHVKAQLSEILAEKDRYNFLTSQPTDSSRESWRVQSTSVIDVSGIYGRDFDRNILVSKLMSNGGSLEELGLQIVSVLGVGGVGKTTLAQLVYNDSRLEESFDIRIWMCVSDLFDEVGVVKGIVERVKGSCPNTKQLDMLLQCLKDCISGKRFLLVLDDVWTEDSAKWDPLKNSLKYGGEGSKVLVTTRSERVAKMMGTIDNDIYYLGQLSDEDCWLLLRGTALLGRSEDECDRFQDMGRDIAKKCKGLPLATKTLGSLLRFKMTLEGWENVLHSEIWQLEEAKVELFPHFILSYNELPPALKRCFSYCAVFPKDYWIDVESLIGNWMAQGYLGSNGHAGDMELRGREYFDNLAMRSLFEDFVRNDLDGQIQSCQMHDLVHDFAQFLRGKGRVDAHMKKRTCGSCNPLLVSHVKEYRQLFCEEVPPRFCDCLISLRVLRLKKCGLVSIPQEIENVIHLRWLDLSHNNFSREDLKTICKLYYLQFLRVHSCELKEISWEIGNLVNLRHLDLSGNGFLKELPESICGLSELRVLNVECCNSLLGLPEGIHRLVNLKHLHNKDATCLKQFPQGLAQLTSLRLLTEFHGGSGWSKLGCLKNLNRLSGSLHLKIKLIDDLVDTVDDAWQAELWKKIHIRILKISFQDEMDGKNESTWTKVVDALEPHPKLQKLYIANYMGFKLPDWITTPLNQLRYINLSYFHHLSSLPSLGKLLLLEELHMARMSGLQFVGREFLGITTGRDMDCIESSSSSSSLSVAAVGNSTTVFPKLKKLGFYSCSKWNEWEDITAEEEDSTISFMPCLTKLYIMNCTSLRALPYRLLRKAWSFELYIHGSYQLEQHYMNADIPAFSSNEVTRSACLKGDGSEFRIGLTLAKSKRYKSSWNAHKK